MSIHEASTLMGVSSATLRRWSDAGRVRTFTTLGGHRRYSRTAVARLLPAEAPDRSARTRRREVSRAAREVPWFAGLDPAARRVMRRHAHRIATSLVASTEAVTGDERVSALAEAESAAADCGALAAGAGIGLRETVEALLGFRTSCLRALTDANSQERDPWAISASVEAATDAFDRLICSAMRAHEAVSGGTWP
jgi:excisionase family DNA binding protein